jgi:hypothetical protein
LNAYGIYKWGDKVNLILFDGTYRLQRQEDASQKTVGECACSWWVRIIDFSIDRPEVRYLRPYVIIATQTGEGIFRTTCAESLGNRIYRDFNLNIDETLWIEHYPHESALYVAIFEPKSYFGTEIFYHIDWRPILPNEFEAIKPFIPGTENIEPP